MPPDPDAPIPEPHASLTADSPPAWGLESRTQRLSRLLAKARALPREPGVYLMKNHLGVVLYVGKARILPNRVSSYFLPSTDLGAKKQPMLDAVHDFEFVLCENEWEALLAENRLIKDIGPIFNARLSDGKTYPYLAVSMAEDFPRVVVTRDLSEPFLKGPPAARLFGPFTSSWALRQAVSTLQRVFKYRTCSLDIAADDPKNRFFRPCILYNIGRCSAPCAAKIDPQPYREDIDRFTRFLSSKRTAILRDMRAEMHQASLDQEYERAASIRDQIRAIEKLDERAKRPGGGAKLGWQPEVEIHLQDPRKGLRLLRQLLIKHACLPAHSPPIRCMEAVDIAHLQGGEVVGSKVCFIDGRPLKSAYRRYRITGAVAGLPSPAQGDDPQTLRARNDDFASIREVVRRRYLDAGQGQELYPDVILIDGGLGQLHAALDALADLDHKPPMVISLAKKEELIFVQGRSDPIRLGRDNPALKLCQAIRDEAHRFAQHYHHILRKKKFLGGD